MLPRRHHAAVVPPRPGWTPQLPAAVGQRRGQVSCRCAQPQELASSTAGSNGTTSSSMGSWPQPLPHLLRCNTGAALLTGGIGAATVYNLIGLGGTALVALCSHRPTLAAGDRPGLTVDRFPVLLVEVHIPSSSCALVPLII
jgi:hypothetical protein